jgi:YggT family protein
VIQSRSALEQALCIFLDVCTLLLLARVVFSWLRPPVSGPLRTAWNALFAVTEPVLAPVRKILPPMRAGSAAVDFSPVVVFLALAVLRSVIC